MVPAVHTCAIRSGGNSVHNAEVEANATGALALRTVLPLLLMLLLRNVVLMEQKKKLRRQRGVCEVEDGWVVVVGVSVCVCLRISLLCVRVCLCACRRNMKRCSLMWQQGGKAPDLWEKDVRSDANFVLIRDAIKSNEVKRLARSGHDGSVEGGEVKMEQEVGGCGVVTEWESAIAWQQ